MSAHRLAKLLATGLLASAVAMPALAAGPGDCGGPQKMGQMGQMGQMQPMMRGGMGGAWGPGRGGGFGPMMGDDGTAMLDRVDGRLAFMKAELKITDDQAQAWTDFADAVRGSAETRNAMMRSMMEDMKDGDFAEMSLPDRLALQETHMEARLQEIKSIKDATDKLYAVLTDEQKAAADEIVLPMMGMGMGRMPRRGQ